jgi:tetratricopeptide (TPR) repeat protein
MLSEVDSARLPLAAPIDTITAIPIALKSLAPIVDEARPGDQLPEVGVSGPLREVVTTAAGRRQAEHVDAVRQSIVRRTERLAADAPDSAMAWARLAQAAFEADRLVQSVAAARQAMQLCLTAWERGEGPDAAAARVAGRILNDTGHWDEAKKGLNRISTVDSALFLASIVGGPIEIAEALERLRGVRGVAARGVYAWLLLRVGRPREAVAELRKLVRQGHLSPNTMANMAYGHALLGSPQKAIKAARCAVALAPSSVKHSFNLVGYFVHYGSSDRAHGELNRLAMARDIDSAEIAMARAGIHMRDRNIYAALDVLERASAGFLVTKSARSTAELQVNIAVLRCQLGELSRSEALSEARRAAAIAAGRSIGVLEAFCDLAPSTELFPEAAALVRQAEEWHDARDLLPLRARTAHLQADFSNSSRLARAWADEHPLNAAAVNHSLLMEAVASGQYADAAKRGKSIMNRFVGDSEIRTNVAYCLAMAGQGKDALDFLPKEPSESISRLATAGLARLAIGDVEEGLALYRDAHRIAERVPVADDRKPLRALVALSQRLAVTHLALRNISEAALLPIELPRGWKESPTLLLMAQKCGLSGDAGHRDSN